MIFMNLRVSKPIGVILYLATVRRLQIPAVQVDIGKKQADISQSGVQINIEAVDQSMQE